MIFQRLVELEGEALDETPEMLSAIDAGVRSIEEQGGIPLEEARRRLAQWITK